MNFVYNGGFYRKKSNFFGKRIENHIRMKLDQ